MTTETDTAPVPGAADAASETAVNRLNAGEVAIELAGTPPNGGPLVLVPTLGAAQMIAAKFGGLSKPWDLVNAFDLDTYVFLIAVGMGRKPDKHIAQAVFETGLVELKEPLIAWLGALANGGRPLERATRPKA